VKREKRKRLNPGVLKALDFSPAWWCGLFDAQWQEVQDTLSMERAPEERQELADRA
jgi:hypothetical protein